MTTKEIIVDGKKYICTFGVGVMENLHKSIVVKKHPNFEGRGLFATDVIKKGEVVWADEQSVQSREKCLTSSQIEKLDDEYKKFFKNYSYQIDDDLFLGPLPGEDPVDDPANFMNHSCDPNTVFISDGTMIAIRDIQPGEEITYDYATSEANDSKTFECRCGAKECRGVFRGDEWKRKDIQEKYGDHFVSFLKRKIKEQTSLIENK